MIFGLIKEKAGIWCDIRKFVGEEGRSKTKQEAVRRQFGIMTRRKLEYVVTTRNL